jgi:hypothetical protein
MKEKGVKISVNHGFSFSPPPPHHLGMGTYFRDSLNLSNPKNLFREFVHFEVVGLYDVGEFDAQDFQHVLNPVCFQFGVGE